MAQMNPVVLAVILVILGMGLGFASAVLASRRHQAGLQTELEQLRRRIMEREAESGALERAQARLDAEAEGLRERLRELRETLALREHELETATRHAAGLERELVELRATHEQKLVSFDEQRQAFEQSKRELKVEFQNLANQILEEKGKSLAQSSQVSLDALLKPFRDQIEGFQKRVNEVHDEAVRGNASLGSEIRRVLEIGMTMSAEANNLAAALKGDKKTTGNWGEVQLEKTLQLAGLIEGDYYASQARFKDGAGNIRQPDFIIKLPDDKHMVLDSKVSLVDYERAVSAENEAEAQGALDAHVRAVRAHIDDLSRKDYSNLLGMRSPSFVLMFMPVEPAYIEALKHNRDLFDYGYQRNVIMVSHTTLLPILRTVANLWMIARSNEQAHELSGRAGEVYNQVALVAERLQKLGATLDLASRRYNDTVTAVAGQQGLYGKAARFNELSAKANKALPAIEPMHADFQTERLELVVGSAASLES